LKVDGVSVNDNLLDKFFVDFIFAYYFHFTPKQVGEIDSDEVEALMSILEEWRKKEVDVSLNGR